ncbi:MAG TPA: cytochrome c family protein [Reyranella sp.]|jgi:cytochrome c|nr:cytochrome c family protein [Reyranella sp.]
MANFNTIAGCFLASALFAMVVGKVSNAVVSPHHLEKPALAVSNAAPEGEGAPKSAEADLPPIGPKLKDANVEHGKQIFKQQCFTCHNDEKGAANKVGPNQWNLVGRKKASEEGFSYSSALKEKGGTWTYEDLNHMIFKPQAFVKGTKMAFAGLPKEQDRADLIAYLRTMNDNPPPLPDAAPANAKPADANKQPEKK